MILRTRARPIFLQGGTDRLSKRAGALIYIFDAIEQFSAGLADYDVSRTNSIVGIVNTTIATNNFFNPTPFKFGIFHITDANTPKALYPGGVTNTYLFLDEQEVGTTLSAQEVKDYIDELATGIGTVEMVRAPDPDGTVKTYVQSNYGAAAWAAPGFKVAGTPFQSSINTFAVPSFGGDSVNLGVQDAYHTVLRYGAPLYVTNIKSATGAPSSVASPYPSHDIGNIYSFQKDTDAQD